MEYGKRLNPERWLRTPKGIKGTRQKVIVTHNPSEIDQAQELLVRFPNLGSDDVIIPGTANLSFNIELTSTVDANRTLVSNIGRAIIKKLAVKFERNEIMSVDDYDVLACYRDLWKTKSEKRNAIRQGIIFTDGCTENCIKLRINAGDKNASNSQDKAIADAYGNKFIIPLDFEMLDSAAPKELEGAFDGAYRRYRIGGIERMDVETFFARTRKFLIDLLNKETMNRAVRSQATTWLRFVRDEVEQVSLAFNSRMMTVYSLNDKNEIVTAMIEHMVQQIENPALRNSKCVFDRVLHMDIDFHRLNLTRGSSYVPLPDWLMKKKAMINPKNSDRECFKWAVIAAMNWEEIGNNPERVSKLRRYEREFDWSGLEFPLSLRDINKFERNNEIGVNILAVEHRKIYICRKGRDYDRIVNLMLIADIVNPNKKHYVAVKSLSRLLSKQNSKHKQAQHFCINCLNGFESERIRDEHYEYCRSKDSVRVEMPTQNPIVKYADGQYQFKVPFVIYTDFESILVPISGAPNNPEMSSTRGINVHQPSGWCMYSKFAYGKVTNPLKQHRSRDCISKFCETIIAEAKRLYRSAPKKPMDTLTKKKMMNL